MTSSSSHPVKAVLGPTNTGKTHLAVERLTARSSGMIGFPLRLLAREVYDRVVAIKGPAEVALITGEERIMPPDARYLLGTMEALPVDRDVAFVGICGTDMHVFHGNMDARVGHNRIIGHEMSGRVASVGSGVEGIAEGDAVVVRPLHPCGNCPACAAGE